MNNHLDKLVADLIGYRQAVDRIFSPALTTPKGWQACFSEILICVSKLYLDYLLVTKNLPAMEAVSSKDDGRRLRADALREKTLRQNLQQTLDSSTCWRHHFKPANSFSELTGLRSRREYTEKLTLHLPEIYEESYRIEACAKYFLLSHDGSALAQLGVGLQHLGRNHASFVLQALEWLAEDDSWEEPVLAPKTL